MALFYYWSRDTSLLKNTYTSNCRFYLINKVILRMPKEELTAHLKQAKKKKNNWIYCLWIMEEQVWQNTDLEKSKRQVYGVWASIESKNGWAAPNQSVCKLADFQTWKLVTDWGMHLADWLTFVVSVPLQCQLQREGHWGEAVTDWDMFNAVFVATSSYIRVMTQERTIWF